jgi:hypothetical protein
LRFEIVIVAPTSEEFHHQDSSICDIITYGYIFLCNRVHHYLHEVHHHHCQQLPGNGICEIVAPSIVIVPVPFHKPPPSAAATLLATVPPVITAVPAPVAPPFQARLLLASTSIRN